MQSKVEILRTDILSDNWYILKRIEYEITDHLGNKKRQLREAYDRGNGATILLYNQDQGTVILTRQFRLPTFINGNPDGMLIEACAGLLDNDETGYLIKDVKKVFEAYMSPGSVTEILYFFVAAYTKDMKITAGGGIEEEQENIEVLELPFVKALEMIESGEIKDGKTIMLLQYAQIHQLL